jgi:hypothetical protein
MQTNYLSTERMLVLSRYWLNNADAQHAFASHELGHLLRTQIAQAYEDLSLLYKRRHDARQALEKLSEIMEMLDDIHDRFARALHHYLTGLATVATDAAEAAWFAKIQAMLFPLGMSIVNSSYADEAGMATSIEQQLTPEIMDKLASIRVGEHTLADLCRGWLDAGISLGQHVIERQRLQNAISRKGPDAATLGIRPVRSRWSRAVNAMLISLDLMNMPDELRNVLVVPLQQMVARAVRERSGQPPPPNPDDDLDDTPNSDLDSDLMSATTSELATSELALNTVHGELTGSIDATIHGDADRNTGASTMAKERDAPS